MDPLLSGKRARERFEFRAPHQSLDGFTSHLQIECPQLFRDWTRLSTTDRAPIDRDDREHEIRSAGQKGLGCAIGFFHSEQPFFQDNPRFFRQPEKRLACDPGKDGVGQRTYDDAPAWVTMKALDEPPSVTKPSSTIQASWCRRLARGLLGQHLRKERDRFDVAPSPALVRHRDDRDPVFRRRRVERWISPG